MLLSGNLMLLSGNLMLLAKKLMFLIGNLMVVLLGASGVAEQGVQHGERGSVEAAQAEEPCQGIRGSGIRGVPHRLHTAGHCEGEHVRMMHVTHVTHVTHGTQGTPLDIVKESM
jgi:hypothetical protein